MTEKDASLYNEDLAIVPKEKTNMDYLELCSALDQHELVYSYIHACEFSHPGGYELVAGDPYNLFG